MIEKIHKLIEEAEAFNTQSLEDVEAFRIKFLGKKGVLTGFLAGFKEVPNEEKKDYGLAINKLKDEKGNFYVCCNYWGILQSCY